MEISSTRGPQRSGNLEVSSGASADNTGSLNLASSNAELGGSFSISVGDSVREAAGSVLVSAGATSDQASPGGGAALTGGRGAVAGRSEFRVVLQILKMVEQLQ